MQAEMKLDNILGNASARREIGFQMKQPGRPRRAILNYFIGKTE